MRTPSSNSTHHPMAWSLAISVLIPVLYVLTVPPLVFGYSYFFVTGSATVTEPPPWVQAYFKPYARLCQVGMTKGPCRAYADWWRKVIGLPSP